MIKLAQAVGAAVLLCVASSAIAAPDVDVFAIRVDELVRAEMQKQKVPGVAIAVLRKGEIIVAKGYGHATVEHDIPVTTDTIFQSGSMGKMFTAAAIMTQVERGKIALDDPIIKYLPDAPASWRPITIRQLLTHTSGIPEYAANFDYRRDYTDNELVKIAYARPLDFKPGARWSYSNTGYALLGILVKKASGQSYLDVLKTRIFTPLGMKTARGISDADIVPNRSSGYQLIDGVLKNQDWVSPTMNSTADGSLYYSLNDVIAWARGVEKGAVLSSGSWKQVYTPVRLNSGKPYPYGFGWMLDEAGGHPRYHHGGAWQGFRTFYSRYLGDDLSIILLTNAAHTKLDTFVDGIAGLWDPALVAPAPHPKPEPEAARRVTALLEAVRGGTLRKQDIPLAGAGFAELANQHFGPKLEALGPLQKLELTDLRELGDDKAYTYAATYRDRTVTVKLRLAPGDQASAFMVSE